MLRLRGLDRLRGMLVAALPHQVPQPPQVQLNVALRAFAAEAAAKPNPYYNVPAGHINSDLSDTVCTIGLGRLRDLTMRQDLRLTPVGGSPATLKDLLKGKRIVLFGVPDMGKVCTEQHVPSFVQQAEPFSKLGVDQVYCVAVASSQQVQEWAAKVGIDGTKIQALADENGGFTRLMGLEFGDPASAAKSQRYAALVDDGILLRLRVEKSPADVKESSGEAMAGCIQEYYSGK